MRFLRQIGCSGARLDSVREASVSWPIMSRWMVPVVLVALAGAGCSGSPAPLQANQMAPTPRPAADEPKTQQAPVAAAPAPAPSGDGIAARVNNDIITWKDVRDVLKDIKPADQTP